MIRFRKTKPNFIGVRIRNCYISTIFTLDTLRWMFLVFYIYGAATFRLYWRSHHCVTRCSLNRSPRTPTLIDLLLTLNTCIRELVPLKEPIRLKLTLSSFVCSPSALWTCMPSYLPPLLALQAYLSRACNEPPSI